MGKIKNIVKKIENNKLIVIPFKIIKSLLYIFAILLLIVVIVQKSSNNTIAIGGYRIFTVVSKSMKPEYDIGDILVSKEAKPDEINKGDNITYLGKKDSLKGLTITHKVINKYEEEKITYYETKGTANEISDPIIEHSQVYGKVVYKTILFSLLGRLMYGTTSYYILCISIGLIVSIEIVQSIYSKDDEDENGEENE